MVPARIATLASCPQRPVESSTAARFRRLISMDPAAAHDRETPPRRVGDVRRGTAFERAAFVTADFHDLDGDFSAAIAVAILQDDPATAHHRARLTTIRRLPNLPRSRESTERERRDTLTARASAVQRRRDALQSAWLFVDFIGVARFLCNALPRRARRRGAHWRGSIDVAFPPSHSSGWRRTPRTVAYAAWVKRRLIGRYRPDVPVGPTVVETLSWPRAARASMVVARGLNTRRSLPRPRRAHRRARAHPPRSRIGRRWLGSSRDRRRRYAVARRRHPPHRAGSRRDDRRACRPRVRVHARCASWGAHGLSSRTRRVPHGALVARARRAHSARRALGWDPRVCRRTSASRTERRTTSHVLPARGRRPAAHGAPRLMMASLFLLKCCRWWRGTRTQVVSPSSL